MLSTCVYLVVFEPFVQHVGVLLVQVRVGERLVEQLLGAVQPVPDLPEPTRQTAVQLPLPHLQNTTRNMLRF